MSRTGGERVLELVWISMDGWMRVTPASLQSVRARCGLVPSRAHHLYNMYPKSEYFCASCSTLLSNFERKLPYVET